jgi:maltooligosyltrehalose trehalohydrolase
MRIGAFHLGDGRTEFSVWAPRADSVSVILDSPPQRQVPMAPVAPGYWGAAVENVPPGTLYRFRLNGRLDRPDPASRYQPQGVHGPSQVVDHAAFRWRDAAWTGIALTEMIQYELHVGTFTPEGTLDAVIPRLKAIRDVGINAVELMPVAQFPGDRNWGYDGAYPFAVQNSYGGPDGLKRLVDAAHQAGISVILDVVYNHLGPEGNYLSDFGPYFTGKYNTPWGPALNFDDAHSDEVRNFFIENALQWFRDYHVDALRLDAVHAINDASARTFLAELADRTRDYREGAGKRHWLIAESDLNDIRIIDPPDRGGFGLDAQWCDDFHHALHAFLTGENRGYYVDFGAFDDLVTSLRDGFVYSGRYSRYRNRRHGNSSKDRPGGQFVVYSQNHDHVGNRLDSNRLSKLIPFEGLKLAAGLVILSPYIPMLFMGEEYGEESPFCYFVSHSDRELVEAVRNGRREEFKAFGWKEAPADPQSEETFLRSKLHWEERNAGQHGVLLEFYRSLIALRKCTPALSFPDKKTMAVRGYEKERVIAVRRGSPDSAVLCLFNLNPEDVGIAPSEFEGRWEKRFDSSDSAWSGPGTLLPERIRGLSFAVFENGGG